MSKKIIEVSNMPKTREEAEALLEHELQVQAGKHMEALQAQEAELPDDFKQFTCNQTVLMLSKVFTDLCRKFDFDAYPISIEVKMGIQGTELTNAADFKPRNVN